MEELYLAALNSGIGGSAQGEDSWDDGSESYRGFNAEDDNGVDDEEAQERRAKKLNRKRRLAKRRKAEARWAA